MTSALRELLRGGRLDRRRAELALVDLIDLPITRISHRRLVPRCWELRDNLTTYDAAYVAAAAALGILLVTADRGLAGASGIRCATELLA